MEKLDFRHTDEQRNRTMFQNYESVTECDIVQVSDNGRYHTADFLNFFQTNTCSPFDNTETDGQTANVYSTEEMDSICDALECLKSDDMPDVPVESQCCGCGSCLSSFDMESVDKIYSQDVDGDTLLHSAIITLNGNLAEHFVNITPSWELLNVSNKLKQTPLHLAVLTEQASVVRRLMIGGADILSRDRDGNTPLHIACREGYTDIVRILLEPVRYLEIKQNRYDIPYQRIPQDLYIANYDGLSCLHLASLGGHLDVVMLLAEKHADINCRDIKSGRTPLHNACVDGNLALVKLLLLYKTCNINARTYNNLTPLDLARDRGYLRITFELAAAGAMAANDLDVENY